MTVVNKKVQFHSFNFSKRPKEIERKLTLYPGFSEIYNLCEQKQYIQRLKDINQLGSIKVSKNIKKSRLEYIFFQLYLHNKVQQHVGTRVTMSPTYTKDFKYNISIGDAIQIFVLIYNLGHFHNTFIASRGFLDYLAKSEVKTESFKSLLNNTNLNDALDYIIERRLYPLLHLFNSYIILDSFDSSLSSVLAAKDLLTNYIQWKCFNTCFENMDFLSIFKYFESVRSLAYIINDLQVSSFPLFVRWDDERILKTLLYEYFDKYNDSHFLNEILKGVGKILSDNIYNNINKVISYTEASKRLTASCTDIDFTSNNTFIDSCLKKKDMCLNKEIRFKSNYNTDLLFKLTIGVDDYRIAHKLYEKLRSISFIRVGYYKRNSYNTTLVVSVKKNLENKAKAVFKAYKLIIYYLGELKDSNFKQKGLIVATKFFLKSILGHNLEVKDDIVTGAILMSRGYKKRVNLIEESLRKEINDEDALHEFDVFKQYLQNESKNDLAVMIPNRVIVYNNDTTTKKELDGILIFPNRKCNQIVLIEAKNIHQEPVKAIRQLNEIDALITDQFIEISPAEQFQGFDAIKVLNIKA